MARVRSRLRVRRDSWRLSLLSCLRVSSLGRDCSKMETSRSAQRRRRQDWLIISRVRDSSSEDTGTREKYMPLEKFRYSSRSSVGRTATVVVMPHLVELRADTDLPRIVRGPVDFSAFSWLALSLAAEICFFDFLGSVCPVMLWYLTRMVSV